MEPEILLAQLRALIERAPDFEQYSPTSREHLIWLGQAHALISRWNKTEAISFQLHSDTLTVKGVFQMSLANIFGIIHRAIADLEFSLPPAAQVTFAAGEVYDFFRELNKVIESAEKSIFIVDPYLDHTVFDQYLVSRKPEVSVRLLLKQYANKVKPSAEKYVQQFGPVLEVRKSNTPHDRVIFIDGYVCWIVGQSLKEAAKAKPTYLVQFPPDIVADKLQIYEAIWIEAEPI